jgi:hypothetical protein
LRENVIPTEIYEKHSLENYIKHFTQKKDWNIYFNTDYDLNPEFIDESFILFRETNKDKGIVRIK